MVAHQWANTRPKQYILDFFIFGIKQAQACLFGGALLFGILLSKFFWPETAFLARYDALFIYAFLIQGVLLLLKMETLEEAKVIFIFHLVGTIMEIFKTHVGSWTYPEANLIRIGGVPLFTGFMYAAVGSYIARAWRIFDFKFISYPPKAWTALLCLFIYLNFFTHHYIPDIRYGLFAAAIWLFLQTRIYFRPSRHIYWMPLLIGWGLVSLFIWFAENIGTFAGAWVYPNQHHGWNIVSPAKMGSWYLLMIISFVLVTFIHTDKKEISHAA